MEKKLKWKGMLASLFFASLLAWGWSIGIEWPAIFAIVLSVTAIRDTQQEY